MKILRFGALLAAASFANADVVETCQACHGANGEGNPALSAPALAGNLESYLTRQLEHFKTGKRGGSSDTATAQTMAASIAAIELEALETAAEYFANLSTPEIATTEANDQQADAYYQALCGSCHGQNAEGNEIIGAPRIAGLTNQYITQQIKSFQDGSRSQIDEKHPRQMQHMVKAVDDDMMPRIIEHIGSLNGEKYVGDH